MSHPTGIQHLIWVGPDISGRFDTILFKDSWNLRRKSLYFFEKNESFFDFLQVFYVLDFNRV